MFVIAGNLLKVKTNVKWKGKLNALCKKVSNDHIELNPQQVISLN